MGELAQQASKHTHTHTPAHPPHTHTPNAHTNSEKAGLERDVGSPHTLASHLPVFGRFRGKTIQRPRGAIAWRQRAFDPPESHLEMWHFEGEGRAGGHLTNLGLSRGNAQVSGPGIASVNGVPLTRRRDHWHTGSLVSMALVALVGSGDSELTGDKLLFMAKAQGPAERQDAPSSWLGNKVSQSVCSWRVLGLGSFEGDAAAAASMHASIVRLQEIPISRNVMNNKAKQSWGAGE